MGGGRGGARKTQLGGVVNERIPREELGELE